MLVRRLVRSAVDDAALGIERPPASSPTAPNRSSRTTPRATRTHHIDLCGLVHLADCDKAQIGLGGDCPHLGDRVEAKHLVAEAPGCHQNGNGMDNAVLRAVGERPTVSKEARRAIGREYFPQRHDLMIGTIDSGKPARRRPARLSRPQGDDRRLFRAQGRFQDVRARSAMPRRPVARRIVGTTSQ